ncbi:hypothetical protein ASF69_04620 [Rhizobium sp. Leaf311]|uniref:hypothetical protein n=1 Tax=Rhizobium sp. Leaf311 TaxID=1736332 RepID=UPI000715A07A|nr:hypothetical protein [Rhizobium sp. Leaf311]KQQ46514.1 hypothetical protein ASF69_04620 [Rhizobium sp. Leaf311]
MPQVRVNVRSLANVKAVRKEKRNGRDVVIVPSATLPDDVVMNGILYPADEIEKSFAGLERSPAPLGHPTINGKFVSARDPEGLNLGWIGAWNENLRRENGRVFLDKVIDVEMANRSEGGKRVLNAIEKGKPVHTSTGLFALLEAANGDVPYKNIAREIEFDHDAILLDEDGAATPEQGVGMMVNAKGEREEIQVINSSITDDIDREIDWAGSRLVDALKRRESVGTWEKMKAAILEAMGFSEREPTTNTKDEEMTVEEQIKALAAKVDTLSETAGKPSEAVNSAIAEAVTNAVTAALKPVLDQHEALVANQKAQEEAETAELVEKVVKANLLDEATAKATPLNTLRALAPKTEMGKAAPLNSAFKANGNDKPAYKAPEGE